VRALDPDRFDVVLDDAAGYAGQLAEKRVDELQQLLRGASARTEDGLLDALDGHGAGGHEHAHAVGFAPPSGCHDHDLRVEDVALKFAQQRVDVGIEVGLEEQRHDGFRHFAVKPARKIFFWRKSHIKARGATRVCV
jgi:hypothetical protein